jgi:UPF0716 protein FxsA
MAMSRLLLFLAFPALELYLLVKVGALVGALNMVLWVFGSAFFGFWVVGTHSQYSFRRMRADLNAGLTPQNPMLDGLLVFLAGVLLILPGLITDAAGLLLLVPLIRRLAVRRLEKHMTESRSRGSTTFFFSSFGGPFGGQSFGGQSFGGGGFTAAPPGGHASNPLRDDHQDNGPRQATIIESTAIEINTDGEKKKE